MRHFLTTTACTMAFLAVQSFAQTNVALYKAVTVSSVQSGNAAANAVDNNTGTRWAASSGTLPQWLTVDLASNYNITSSQVMWEATGVWQYKVEISTDNVTWGTPPKVDRTANTLSQQTFTDTWTGTARYVRITTTGRPSANWASIYEFRIYGTNANLPTIATQPVNQSVTAGMTATFSVVAAGAPPFTYQWKKGTAIVPGATAASYTTPATTMADNGSTFLCEVSNSYGTVASNPATLTVTTSCTAPAITTQPVNQSVAVGLTATFSVVATGTSLSYQWKKGGTNISGATAASYTTPATTMADNGAAFTCYLSNGCGNVTSAVAILSVGTVPTWVGTVGGLLYANPVTTKVAIGYSTPGTEMLEVAGFIKCAGLKINTWSIEAPDYVFSKNYKLRSLEEVEKHIEATNHLPEVPSAADMKKNGVDLSELNMTLLKKVEELTLYVIEQNKKIEALEKKTMDK